MRTGGCTVQQSLTAEAATVVKQAVALARRRGHAQVTPLHVANTMLSAPTGLLRTACLQSHSHPLQCKALELCFNVALNRLPASSSTPMFGGPHSQNPSISNALVAAFKRAQAHQRRGTIENQQQPILAVKIELEQLIISILDDPSVSRVMREAGFSSTQVKSNVEQTVSLELCSQNPPSSSNKPKENDLLQYASSSQNGSKRVPQSSTSSDTPSRDKDMNTVIESLLNRRRKSVVIVGECVSSLEGVVRDLMDKVDKGDVPELREVKFVSISLFSFDRLRREEVEQKIGELACFVKSVVAKGVILYLGDLKWINDYRGSTGGQDRSCYYCPVEHMIVELGRLICGIGEINARFWLLGIATFETYLKCRTGQHPLESVWSLHPVTIPAASLGLSLLPDSDAEDGHGSKKSENGSTILLETGIEKKLNCCADCSAKFEVEARSLQQSIPDSRSTLSSLPPWLKDERKRLNNNDQNSLSVRELCQKWNAICSSVHGQRRSFNRTLTFPSASPSSSASCFSYDHQYPNFLQHRLPQNEPKQHAWRDHQFWTISTNDNKTPETSMKIMYNIPDHHQPFSSNPNSTPNSATSSDVIMEVEYVQRFREFNSENLNIICSALEQKVPWQKEIIADIAGTILQCRSGMVRRKDKLRSSGEAKEETWLFFQGLDVKGKEKIARELANVVFGSLANFHSVSLSSFSISPRADSSEDLRNKRLRDEQHSSYIERFGHAVSVNPHRVFYLEDLEQVDYCSQMGLKRAIERGQISSSNGEEVSLSDAIIILSCESFSSRSRACSPQAKQKWDGTDQEKINNDESEETSPCASLDLNISFDDEDDQSIDDIGLLENVDRRVVFNIQEL